MEKFSIKYNFNIHDDDDDVNEYSDNNEFMECDWRIKLRSQGEYTESCLGIFLDLTINPNFFMYCKNIEYKLLSKNKEALVRKDDQFLYLKSASCGYDNFISWEDLFDDKNGYANDYAVTVEIHFNAKKINQKDMRLFLQSICEEITDLHTLEIKKQNEKIFDLDKIRDEAKIIIDLVSQGKHIKTDETEIETLTEFNAKYEYVKQELEKFEENDNSKVDNQNSLKFEDKLAIYLAKLKLQNEDLEEELKITENSKKRLENRVKTLRQQLETVIEAKEEEAEKKRRDIVIKLRNVEIDLEEERKKNALKEIEINKLQYKLQDVDIEFKSIKIDLHNKEKQLKTVEKVLQEKQTQLKNVENDLQFEKSAHKETEFKLQNIIEELNKLKFDFDIKEKQLLNVEDNLQKKQTHLTNVENNLVKDQLHFKNVECVNRELESKLQNVTMKLSNAKSDFEEKQKDIQANLEEERKRNEDNKMARKQLETKLIEMEIQLENENSFKKLHEQLKVKLIKQTSNELLIANLEQQIEKAEKEKLEQSKSNRKLENDIKQRTIYSEAEKQQIEQYQKELKDLKTELDKAKEEINKEKLEKEKTQRKYEDMSASLELLKQENKTFKTLKLRNVVKSTTSSFCEIDKEDSISIISAENEFEDDLNTQ